MHLAEMREGELEAKVMSATRSTQRIKRQHDRNT